MWGYCGANKIKSLIRKNYYRNNFLILLARPARLERATCGFEVRRSIQLSYGRGGDGVSEGIRTLGRWGHNPVLYPAELHSP